MSDMSDMDDYQETKDIPTKMHYETYDTIAAVAGDFKEVNTLCNCPCVQWDLLQQPPTR